MTKIFPVLALLAWLLWWPPAQAVRNFPQDALRGTLTAHTYPIYRIGSATYRLAPGGRIFNQQNLIIMPVSLTVQRAEIMYRIDHRGDLSEIWLLTREEAELNPTQGNRQQLGPYAAQ